MLRRKKDRALKLCPQIGKSCGKCAPKANSRLLFILVNNPKQPLNARNYFKNKIFSKKIIKNVLKNLLYFFSNPIPFKGQSYQLQTGSGTSDMLLFRLWNKFTKISLLVIQYLTKFDVRYYITNRWCNMKRFLSYSKKYTCKFM